MSKTEQDRIKRQLNYYLAKNIEALKSKFYGEDGIWSKYQKFIDRFEFDGEKIKVKKLCTNTDVNTVWEELNLDTYSLGKGDKNPEHNENGYGSLSWWVEFYLKDLGAVGGSSSAVHGIYYSPKSKCYRNTKNKDILEENVAEQSKEDNSHFFAQERFNYKTYICIKRKLVFGGNIEDEALSDFKPNNVVLNKIYYLFKMQELDKQGCANSHLIPIFKEESINAQKDRLNLFFAEKENWEIKSARVYDKFEEFLKDRPKDEGEALFKISSEQEKQNNANLVEIKDDNLIKIAQNLFKSYCFGCFFWSTFENQGGLSKKIDELISRGDKNIILTGAPGTGKTFACQSYAKEQIADFLSECKEQLNLKTDDDLKNEFKDISFVKTVQFHPGYDYSDFIEGLRPKRDSKSNTIIYDRKDGIFKNFCRQVVKFNENHKYANLAESAKFFFIIDEINRGEVSKVFGEAFSMIETDKRAPVDLESEKVTNKVDTQYSSLIEDKDNDPFQHGFYIPENVYILATMNEIDRSLEAMDFAFRRRFSWLTVEVEDTLNEIIVNSVLDACTNSVSSCMSEIEKSFNALNGLIKDNLGSDYMLGGSYLTSLKNSSRTSVKTLKEELWNNHLEPIIKDYIKGSEDKIEDYKSKFVDSKKEDSKNDAS